VAVYLLKRNQPEVLKMKEEKEEKQILVLMQGMIQEYPMRDYRAEHGRSLLLKKPLVQKLLV
jgi:hypothetical protein